MSVPIQIVPWYDVDEWHEVYNELYENSSISSKQRGLDRLLLWKARCPALPSAIDSTLTLLQVHIQDVKNRDTLNSDYLIRLAYSSALMRFVNHTLDSETSKGLNLFRAAKNIGIPDWIIELRHDTAHSERLPSIEQLREATKISLDWLQKHYWDTHKQCIENFIIETVHNQDVENIAEALINVYMSLSICSHSRSKVKKIGDIEDIHMKQSLVNDIKDVFGNSADLSDLESVTIHSLIDMMNMKAKKLFNSSVSISQYANKVLISEDSLFLSLELHNLLDFYNFEFTKSLSNQYIKCFEKLLEFLHINDLLKDFVLELIMYTQREENCNRKKQLAARWVSAILQALKRVQQFVEKLKKTDTNELILKDRKKCKKLYLHWYPNEKENVFILDLRKGVPKDMTNMAFIKPIISTYNCNLTYFIRDLLNLIRPALPGTIIEKIYHLARVVAYPEKFPNTSSRVYTVDDLKPTDSLPCTKVHSEIEKCAEENKDFVAVTSKENNHEKFGIWQKASNNHNWASCPIGQQPQQTCSMES